MRALTAIGIILVAEILQATFLSLFSVHGTRPDLLLIVVMSYGLLYGKDRGISVGFFAGLLQDLASGNMFGLNTLSKMLIGYLFGLAERKVFKESLLLPLLGVIVATLMNNVFVFLFLFATGHGLNPAALINNTVLPLVLYNMAACVPVHQVVYRWNKRLAIE